MMHVQLIAKPGGSSTGMGRYTADLHAGLMALGLAVTRSTPAPAPAWLAAPFKRLGYDLDAFLKSYPFSVQALPADIYHITVQTMGTLLVFGRFRAPVVVTVHDIIPQLVQHDPELRTLKHPADAALYRLALRGLRRADALITVSAYVKTTLIETVGLPAERITAIHNPIDTARFRPLAVTDADRARFGLHEGERALVYVGSEDPRKNLPRLLRAFAPVRAALPDVVLLKVGRAHNDEQRPRLEQLIAALGIGEGVRFLEDVEEGDLPTLYNLAAGVVMPSLYEGFGYPPLEAMACGTPVASSISTSLGEIVGDAALTFDPTDTDALTDALLRLLSDAPLRAALRTRGLRHVQGFGMEAFSRAVQGVYLSVLRPNSMPTTGKMSESHDAAHPD